MRIRASLDSFETKEELRAGRKLLNRAVKEGLKEAGQRAVLPEAKRRSPAIVSQALTTKASIKGAYLTTLGRMVWDSITGLLNFGGSPRGRIEPKKKKALHLRGGGVVVGAVGHEGRIRARYRGQHFLEKAINDSVPAMEEIAAAKVMEAFGRPVA